jgi:transmembrane sensor
MLDNRTWLLIGRKMAHEASPQELQELESILRSNPELHFSLQTLSDLWKNATVEDTEELEEAYKQLLSRMNALGAAAPGMNDDELSENPTLLTYQKKNVFKNRGLLAISISVLAAIFVWMLTTFRYSSLPVKKHETLSEISTRYGSKTTNIVLPDGSRVWLNAGSKITYDKDFGEATRDVKLVGEAYFDVIHNSLKPFIIHTRVMDIKVLGTEFNVKSYPDEKTTETSLIRGSIEVTFNDRRAEKIVLKPNQKLVVSNENPPDPVFVPKKLRLKKDTPIINLSHLNYFSLDSTILETSWVNNRLVFEDESFAEISTRMSRWYGLDFYFDDEETKNLRFTGNFKNETINEALKAMQITADFKFSINDKKVNITKH